MHNRTWLILAVLAACALAAHAATYTMDAYYPSPAGVYKNITVTSTAVLARDGGGVTIGTSAKPANLSVSGLLVPANLSADPTSPEWQVEGGLYYNSTTKKYRVYKSNQWTDIATATPRDAIVTSNGQPWTGSEYCTTINTDEQVKACIRATSTGQIQTFLKAGYTIGDASIGTYSDTGWVNGFASITTQPDDSTRNTYAFRSSQGGDGFSVVPNN